MSDADSAQHVLPDVLEPGLRLVFCGTAAGARSARDGAYYAHPGNRFWRAVFAVGLTPRLLVPAEFPLMPGFGIGFTDVAKFHHGNDNQLPRGAYDAIALHAKIERAAPRVVAFTSKQAGMAALGRRTVATGRQAEPFAGAIAWVLPSPSGQARGSWNLATWQAMADEVRQLAPGIDR
ncbi:mismatch-specific DNA-glycosylase [Luteibacter yeojuensis]|uniref:Glycosylase n=1 Tax=Luteibacter yeojuensis TaxID=345309 RepID=A0A0F3KPR3_9GAMM|nr:mismatch-specific DNA-glycosylase [Luteibacter yeojuensis]KJV33151.1 glycosylase [Luteibacter yeojuensis]